MIKRVLSFIGKTTAFSVFMLAVMFGAQMLFSKLGGYNRKVDSQTPVITDDKFQDVFGSRVYKITPTNNFRSGGTGFAALAKSGKTVIVTNHHICEVADKDGMLMIHTEDGQMVLSKIQYNSPIEDLCVVYGLPGSTGLRIANFAEPSTYIVVLGHPYLEPLTASAGIIDGYELTVTGEIKKNDCNKFGEKVDHVKAFGIFDIEVCTKTLLSMSITARIYPGNSGSPVLNLKGEVTGVVYAGDPRTAKGSAMTLYALADLLDRF